LDHDDDIDSIEFFASLAVSPAIGQKLRILFIHTGATLPTITDPAGGSWGGAIFARVHFEDNGDRVLELTQWSVVEYELTPYMVGANKEFLVTCHRYVA
jgi:hypothetical protein